MDSKEHCKGHNEVKRCGAKIAYYQCAVAALTFVEIEGCQKLKIQGRFNFGFVLIGSLVVFLVLHANQFCTIRTFLRSGM